MISATKFVTVGVSSIDEGLSLFRNTMGFSVEGRELASASWKRAWNIPETTSMEVVELSANGYGYGRIFLVAFDPPSQLRVRDERSTKNPDGSLDVGPKAIDFYVRPPIGESVKLLEKAGCTFWSQPHRHEIGPTISEEVVFSGPDDVPLLIMVGHTHSHRQLRPGSPEGSFSEVATVSIVIADPISTKSFYCDALGLSIITEAESEPQFADLVGELVGAPKGTRISWITFAEAGQASGKILALHFHERTGRRLSRRMLPGALGFSLLSHHAADLDLVHKKLVDSGFEIITAPTEIVRFGKFERVLLVRGPNEEMLELGEQA